MGFYFLNPVKSPPYLLLCPTVIISTTVLPAFDYIQKLMMDYEIRCVIDPRGPDGHAAVD